MNGWEALKIDSAFYAEYDPEYGWYGVFGDNSGFCYANYTNLDEAELKAETMNQNKA